ncbi:hypothetical protein VNO80_04662 [Phaseolus coccineus]|uniref:Uncharacterized protein n=1 Tax=Phaseolus coccineus TaxID=3886 RepID=A0AAN9NYA1_PHACN
MLYLFQMKILPFFSIRNFCHISIFFCWTLRATIIILCYGCIVLDWVLCGVVLFWRCSRGVNGSNKSLQQVQLCSKGLTCGLWKGYSEALLVWASYIWKDLLFPLMGPLHMEEALVTLEMVDLFFLWTVAFACTVELRELRQLYLVKLQCIYLESGMQNTLGQKELGLVNLEAII